MLALNAQEERRSSRRYRVQEGAFAFINNTPLTIRNISEGGLLLQSVVFDEEPEPHLMLDIFVRSEDFYLKNIPVRLVSNTKSKAKTPFSAIQARNYGIAFGKLDDQQRNLLFSLITNNTVGEA